jgi:hypothetical protein
MRHLDAKDGCAAIADSGDTLCASGPWRIAVIQALAVRGLESQLFGVLQTLKD